MPIFLAMVLAPAAVLVLWYAMPPIKILMIDVVSSWGATVGLSGFALLLANAMPLIVPIVCIGAIIAGFIAAARGSKVG